MSIKSNFFSVSLILDHKLTSYNHALYDYTNAFPKQLGQLSANLLLLRDIIYHLEYFGSFQNEIIVWSSSFLELTFNLNTKVSERLLHVFVFDVKCLVYIGCL